MNNADGSSPSTDFDGSMAPSMLDALSREQQMRLTEILDKYLRDLENALPPRAEQLLESHPDLRDVLAIYLENLNRLHEVTAAFGQPDARMSASEEEMAVDGQPRRLGDFELVREVGRGGMGVVYEARQISLDRRVALKVLPFAAVLERQQIARFKNEAQAAAQLHHPNIVPVYAVGAERGVHYYAMQFIDGQPLDRAIAALRTVLRRDVRTSNPGSAVLTETAGIGATTSTVQDFAPRANSLFAGKRTARQEYFRTVMRLVIQAADALHAAHSYGVVHRDIKPSNLLLDDAGKLWITDFGLARCQDDRTLTRSGEVLGTRQYMSPEQAQGKAALVDQRTDVYSLGATLYELLTLEPAHAKDQSRGAANRSDAEPVRPRKLDPQIPVDLETVVLKAMAIERDERYLTAEEFAADLRRVLEGKSTVARPPTLFDRSYRFARRHRRAVALAAAACLLAMLGLSASALVVNRAREAAQQNFERAERHFRDARHAVDQFGSLTAQRLANVPGAESVRRELLEDTLRYYERFAKESGDDPALRDDVALTYSKIGTLYDEMGDSEAAIRAHRQALDLARQSTSTAVDPTEAERREGICHNNLGLALHRAGRIDEAQQEFARAIELQKALCATYPTQPQYSADLASSYSNLGLLQRETGKAEQARTSLGEAIRLQRAVAAAVGNDPASAHDLAASLNNLASLVREQDPAESIELQRQAAEYQAQAAGARPNEPQYKSDWALTLNNLGAAYSAANDTAQAVTAYQKAIELQKELLRMAPLDRGFRRDLAVSYNNIGLAFARASRTDDAQRSFKNAVGFQEQLAAENPHDLETLSSLGGVYNNLGIMLEQLGRTDDAVESFQKAVERQKAAQAQAPKVDRYREFLSRHYYNLGRALRKLGRAEEAAKTALARKQLWRDNPDRLLSVAEELALASQMLSEVDPSKGSANDCAEWSVATLREAVAAGLHLPDDLDRQSSFAALRGRADFDHLIHP